MNVFKLRRCTKQRTFAPDVQKSICVGVRCKDSDIDRSDARRHR